MRDIYEMTTIGSTVAVVTKNGELVQATIVGGDVATRFTLELPTGERVKADVTQLVFTGEAVPEDAVVVEGDFAITPVDAEVPAELAMPTVSEDPTPTGTAEADGPPPAEPPKRGKRKAETSSAE